MTSETVDFLVHIAYGALLCVAWRAGRREREVAYLRSLAGSKNLWSVRCDVCLKPMRDKASVTDTTTSTDGHSLTSVSYHMDRCATIVRKRTDRPTA